MLSVRKTHIGQSGGQRFSLAELLSDSPIKLDVILFRTGTLKLVNQEAHVVVCFHMQDGFIIFQLNEISSSVHEKYLFSWSNCPQIICIISPL